MKDQETAPLALVVSDLHLCHTKPTFRAESQEEWYGVMDRYLGDLRFLQLKSDLPVLIAGDVFDRWNPPPELINFALASLPKRSICIPGQHDLPYHQLENIDKCAYGTLARASDRVHHLPPSAVAGPVGLDDNVWLWSFPWGSPIQSLPKILAGFSDPKGPWKIRKGAEHIAICHSYIWRATTGFPGAKAEDSVEGRRSSLSGYSTAIFGDNHKHFYDPRIGKCSVYNCGTFFRRRADEYGEHPGIGVLFRKGTVRRIPMHCAEDRFLLSPEDHAFGLQSPRLEGFQWIDEALQLSQSENCGFREAILRTIETEKVSKPVARLLQAMLENVQGGKG